MLLSVLKKSLFAGKAPSEADIKNPAPQDVSPRVLIITPPHTVFLAHLIFKCFFDQGILATVNIGEYNGKFDGRFFVVVCPQVFKRLPDSFIAFQMEQAGTHWFGQQYIEILKNPRIRILDYSSQNLPFLADHGIPLQHVRVAQPTIFPDYASFLRQQGFLAPHSPAKEYDILFYGGINERRFLILAELMRHFRLRVAVGVFGPELYELILRSRMIVNIHIAESSPLESTRIFESLSLGAKVVSEDSPDSGDFGRLTNAISLVRPGKVEALIEAIEGGLEGTSPLSTATHNIDAFSASVKWAANELCWD